MAKNNGSDKNLLEKIIAYSKEHQLPQYAAALGVVGILGKLGYDYYQTKKDDQDNTEQSS